MNNTFDEEKERRQKRHNKSYFSEQRAKMIKQRTGLSRHNTTLIIHSLRILKMDTPEIVRERWFHVPYGRTYHFALLRYTFQMDDGRTYTALQAQAHDANYGHMLNITGFWNVIPA